ncbi:hypothetical protein AURDEDRAFT_165650 [Auricularia subglabra TFB-10046 SS5]|nr:hypothetical protein AURDEDRAFT_165650 [Auricularia subglabra TFB-10046 SS5]
MVAPFQPDIVVEDDDLAHVLYLPAAYAWTSVQGQSPLAYHGGSYHMTNVMNASATFMFEGSFVAYYSDHNIDHGVFSVALDGAPVAQLSTFSTTLIRGALIFSAAVSPGRHTLTITNAGEGKIVGVDYFVETSSAGGVQPSLDPAAVTGIALGAVAGAALLFLCGFAFCECVRRKRNNLKAAAETWKCGKVDAYMTGGTAFR